MSDKPLVSIIIPNYNKGKYLPETLASVFKQGYTNWECIIVDDGSTDEHTLQVLRGIKHDKVSVVFSANKGVSAARNQAVALSRGKYIVPLDADDLIADSYLAETVSVIEGDPSIKVVNTKVQLFGHKTGTMALPPYNLQTLLARNTMVVTALFRKTDFVATGGYNVNMRKGFEDWDFWLSFLADGGRVHTIQKPLFSYRIVKNSRNHSLTPGDLKALRYSIYENHIALYQRFLLDPAESFEYDLLRNSLDYRIGRLLAKPLRFLLRR
ncbi:glycosyltransferase [Chryseolinea sp. T2]|uniref:glycosyltransferase n=1 Tax=Chryseolinea sp. T2 TaxID=3129255 RepID=UPI003076FF56